MLSSPEYDRSAIERYLSGKMKPAEAHALEKAASEDAFLAAAIDGLGALTPTAVDAVKVADISSGKRRLRWVIPVVIGAVAYGLMWFSGEEKTPDSNTTSPVVLTQEEEELKQEIDDWDEAQSADVIKASQTDSSMDFTIRIPVDQAAAQSSQSESVNPRLESFVLFEIQLEEELRDEEPELFAKADPETTTPSLDHQMYEVAKFKVFSYQDLRDRKFDLLNVDPGGLSAQFSNEDEKSNRPPAPPKQMGYVDFLELAMLHFAEGRHKVAEWHFEDILTTYPDDVNALFYSGMAYFHRGKYVKAESRFEAAALHATPAFKEPAEFYLAQTLRHLGKRDEANAMFEKIVVGGGFYAEQAREKVQP